MTDQTSSNRARETAKLLIRKALQRADLEIGRGSYAGRLVRTLRSRDIVTVLDIGANVGQYATLARSAGFDGQIISCEPLSGAFNEISRRSARDDAWTVLNVAACAEPGEAVINVAANSYSSSIRPMTDAHLRTAPDSRFIASETVAVTTVADVVAAHGVDPGRTLLKVDTQGFENEVLQGAGDLVGRFAAIQLELSFVELYEGQLLFDHFVARLAHDGYRIQQLEPGISDPDGRMLQVDGLFVLDT